MDTAATIQERLLVGFLYPVMYYAGATGRQVSITSIGECSQCIGGNALLFRLLGALTMFNAQCSMLNARALNFHHVLPESV